MLTCCQCKDVICYMCSQPQFVRVLLIVFRCLVDVKPVTVLRCLVEGKSVNC
jgi:hypothetical protein